MRSIKETYEKIQQVSGRRPSECSCTHCQGMCTRVSCLGTPDDIIKLLEAGYAEKLAFTKWAAGIIIGVTDRPVNLIAPYSISKRSLRFL